MLRVVRLGLPLVDVSVSEPAEAALFRAIVSFACPTYGGRQCWEKGSQQGELRQGLRSSEGTILG